MERFLRTLWFHMSFICTLNHGPSGTYPCTKSNVFYVEILKTPIDPPLPQCPVLLLIWIRSQCFSWIKVLKCPKITKNHKPCLTFVTIFCLWLVVLSKGVLVTQWVSEKCQPKPFLAQNFSYLCTNHVLPIEKWPDQ